jgi:hypothetical protein
MVEKISLMISPFSPTEHRLEAEGSDPFEGGRGRGREEEREWGRRNKLLPSFLVFR